MWHLAAATQMRPGSPSEEWRLFAAPGQICCTSKVETARSVTTTSCDIERRVGASCTSETTRKPVYRNETIAVPGRGFDEEDRTASAHHDPGAVSFWPPPHKMTRDRCR